MSENLTHKETVYKKWTWVLSIAIPVAVAALFGVNLPRLGYDIEPFTFLPPIYAGINALTAIVLVTAVIAVKNRKIILHQNLIKFAIVLSVLFLLMYVVYHMTSESTVYGDLNHSSILESDEKAKVGASRYIYYFILTSHILLSIAIIPVVLITYTRAILNKIELHKKIARYAFPLWLYVAVTGVVVYFMISPYYA